MSYIIKSKTDKKEFYFAGWKDKACRKPRFTVNERDAKYLDLCTAALTRDNLMAPHFKLTLLKVA